MSKNDNQKLNLILKWTFRMLSVISLLIIGITILIIGLTPIETPEHGWTTKINTEVISLLMVSIIGGLTITGQKAHGDIINKKDNEV